jgi:hypothetical protein
MAAYDAYLSGVLDDFEMPKEDVRRSLEALEPIPISSAAGR